MEVERNFTGEELIGVEIFDVESKELKVEPIEGVMGFSDLESLVTDGEVDVVTDLNEAAEGCNNAWDFSFFISFSCFLFPCFKML